MQAQIHHLWKLLRVLLPWLALRLRHKTRTFIQKDMGCVTSFGHIEDRRLDRMIEIADEYDLCLDDVVRYMGRCSHTAFAAFSERPSRLPLYTKSKVTP